MTMSRIRKYKNLYTAGDNLHYYDHLVMFIKCKVCIFDDPAIPLPSILLRNSPSCVRDTLHSKVYSNTAETASLKIYQPKEK